MLYKLFSAAGRCQPCRILIAYLDKDFPEWQKYIEYIDVDKSMTEEQYNLSKKLNVFSLPSITDNEKILFKGFDKSMVLKLKNLCLSQE